MPLTFAHPAAVLPLLRQRGPFHFSVGLVIGSLAPDFEYFLQFRMSSLGAHSLLGLFAFCLPVSVLVGSAWYSIVSIPLTASLPRFLRDRFLLYSHARPSGPDWLHFLVGALIGASTHIIWDSATHADGFFVERWTLLHYSIHGAIPVYKILQHASTLLGSIALFFAVRSMPTQTTARRISIRYWLVFLLLSSLVFLIAHALAPIPFSVKTLGHYFVRVISSSMSGLLLASLVQRTTGLLSR